MKQERRTVKSRRRRRRSGFTESRRGFEMIRLKWVLGEIIIRNKETVGQGSHVGCPTMLAYLQNDHSDSFILKIHYIKFIYL